MVDATRHTARRSVEDDLAAMRLARGAWKDRDFDGVDHVARLRSGRRLAEMRDA